MSIHDAFLELAAASIDFELDDDEQAELDRHLAGCEACQRAAAGFRDDAAMIAFGAGPDLSPGRSEAILAAALRPSQNRSPLRLLGIAAVVAIVGVGLVAVGIEYLTRSQAPMAAVASSPGASPAPALSGGPTNPSGSTPRSSAGAPGPAASPVTAVLPVRGSGQELGTDVRMAPAPGGDLYVSVPGPRGTTLARLDAGGKPARGWPILLPGASPCDLLLAAADGSVRVVCIADDLVSEFGTAPVRAFAFDAGGRPLSGWPVDVGCCFTGRIIGDELTMYARLYFGDVQQEGQPAGDGWIVTVAADGTVREGTTVPFGVDCCIDTWTVGPDGVAYGTVHDFSGATPKSLLSAVSSAGVAAGFPVVIEGLASGPAFDASGRIHLTVGNPSEPPALSLVVGTNGKAIGPGSDPLAIAATSDWRGAGADYPAPPLVGSDGTTFVIDDRNGTTVGRLGPTGQTVPGWPYRTNLKVEETGSCGEAETGCGWFRAAPTIGPDNILFILRAATKSTAGGSVVAIDQNGRVVDGWPVGLRRPGAQFWSVIVGADGTAYVLAIEPEPNGSHSATILSVAPNSTVDYTATIIEP
jgi:putative zinc finger protein